MAHLAAPRAVALLALGARAEEVAHAHAEPVRDQVRDAEDHHDPVAQVGPRRSRHDRERGHRAVDRAVHEVAQVAHPPHSTGQRGA
jgi:hypothetical protein